MNTPVPLEWLSACGRYSVRLKKPAFRRMVRMAAAHAPAEVGTSLVGSYSPEGSVAIVHGLAPLSDDSQGSRFAFLRGIKGLHSFFVRLCSRFAGKRHYVGEWHSHPDAAPFPSPIDDSNQLAIAGDPAAECPECILLIVGGHCPDSPDLGVFVYSRTSGRIELHPRGQSHTGTHT